MPSIDDIYKTHNDKLKAEDLGNQMYTLTIEAVEYVEFTDIDKKLVLSFVGAEKTLPLNKTNARAIADMYGPDYTMWNGRQITLFSMPVDYQGRTVQGIRIRAPQTTQQPAQAAQPAAAQMAHPVHQPPAQNPFEDIKSPPPTSSPASLDDEIPF